MALAHSSKSTDPELLKKKKKRKEKSVSIRRVFKAFNNRGKFPGNRGQLKSFEEEKGYTG